MGDQEAVGIAAVVHQAQQAGVSLRSQVVLLPHHGRHAAWSTELLAAAQPEWVLASGARKDATVGQPGTPRQVVYTSEAGAIRIESDGKRVGVTSFLGER